MGAANAAVFIETKKPARLTSRETSHSHTDFDFKFDENPENCFYYYLHGEVLNVDPVRAGQTSKVVSVSVSVGNRLQRGAAAPGALVSNLAKKPSDL